MNRRQFIASAGGTAALAALPLTGAGSGVPEFARGAEKLPPLLADGKIASSPGLAGRSASFFIDDVIWFLRDLSRERPKSLFDNSFLKPLKEAHDRYGLKLQLNLFYRTDFYYGMDEFTLAEVPDRYREQWQSAKDWLKLGFHSMQEFPDYPWINADYADVKKLYGMIRGEVERFAGPGVFADAVVPHWCSMSKEGCRALADCGVKVMECTVGSRYRYDGRRERLPYGHAMRIENGRKGETAFFWRDSRNAAILSSVCSYNHISEAQHACTARTFNTVRDPATGMAFKNLFGDAPVLNLVDVPTLKSDTAKLVGSDYLVFSDHEQYFFKEYFAYQSDYMEKIMVMSEMMASNGYKFIFIEDIMGS